MNVVAFGNHLRTYQQIEFAFIKRTECSLKVLTSAYRVAIQTSDARLRKHSVQPLLQLLRTGAEEIYILAPAMSACFRDRRGVTAVVAFHPSRALVVRHCDGTIFALQRLAAGAAQHHGRISTAVQQDHHLFLALQPLFDFFRQLAGDHLLASGFLEFLSHVDDLNLRQRPPLHPVGQFEQCVFILLRIEVGLQRRRSRPQHHHGVRHLGAHNGYVARMISRRFFLLVRGILFLVHNHQRQVGDRSEHCRPCAHYHACLAALDAVPLFGPFSVGKCRVQDGHLFSE